MKAPGYLCLWLVLFPLMAAAETTTAPTAQEQAERAQLMSRSAQLAASIKAARQALKQRNQMKKDLQANLNIQLQESRNRASRSLIGLQYPWPTGLTDANQQMSDTAVAELIDALVQRLLQEMAAQAEISTFAADVIDTDGRQTRQRVTRVGPFVSLSRNNYLGQMTNPDRLRVLRRQPEERYIKANTLWQPAHSGVRTVAIDPTRGNVLAMLIHKPGIMERIQQGGLVGYLILMLGCFGGLLALLRILSLQQMLRKVRHQRRHIEQLTDDNPLGRVLITVEKQKGGQVELIEGRLDEAILKELPRLHWGLPLIRLLAAIAPLLGLLGTVVGMIITFQVISQFGTADAKLMAGGISQALVTTVLGLSVAIPLLLLHSMALASSHRLEQVLDEQAAALVAQRLEQNDA
jgi:biopolymer transport protein ExbB